MAEKYYRKSELTYKTKAAETLNGFDYLKKLG